MKPGIDQAIAMAVLQRIELSRLFVSLDTHMLQHAVTDNHVFDLIKIVSLCYSKIRLHHLAKQANANFSTRRVRKSLSKLILFKNQ